MKNVFAILLVAGLACLPLTSCGDGAARPLARPSVDLPEDDGTLFRPDGPRMRAPGDRTSQNRHDRDPGAMSPGSGGGNNPNAPVPEPLGLLLFGAGMTGLAIARRRRKSA